MLNTDIFAKDRGIEKMITEKELREDLSKLDGKIKDLRGYL